MYSVHVNTHTNMQTKHTKTHKHAYPTQTDNTQTHKQHTITQHTRTQHIHTNTKTHVCKPHTYLAYNTYRMQQTSVYWSQTLTA